MYIEGDLPPELARVEHALDRFRIIDQTHYEDPAEHDAAIAEATKEWIAALINVID